MFIKNPTLVAAPINALNLVAIQLLALITLSAADFGRFSLVYLSFALSSSICMSFIAEAWTRTSKRAQSSEWSDYSTVLSALSIFSGVLTSAIGAFVFDGGIIILTASLSVVFASYRVGSRFYSVVLGAHREVVTGDIAGLTSAFAGWAILRTLGNSSVEAIVLVWLISTISCAAASRRPSLRLNALLRWYPTHKRQIVPLMTDSFITDISSIGTPFLIAPMMGVNSFGVYRAVANVSAPVRLLLTPIRPLLASQKLGTHTHPIRTAGVFAASIFAGGCTWGALQIVGDAAMNLGVLEELGKYSLPTALFVGATLLLHYYSLISRAHVSRKRLLTGRILQTSLGTLLPVAGVLLGGLSLAIWATAIATMASSLTWATLVLSPASTNDL